MSQDVVLTELADGVLVVRLNRPDRLNAWTPEMETRYFTILEDSDRDPEVRAIVLTGSGRGFCAGADMSILNEVTEGAGRVADQRPFFFAATTRKPLIAAINGACAGVGMVQALYCDVRFVANEAKLTTAFARRGLPAEYGISWTLPRLVGRGRALELLLSGRILSGAEAAEFGLAEWAYPAAEVVERAVEFARELAIHSSPWSMAAIKAQVATDLESDLEPAVARSAALIDESFGRSDLAEGVASYEARRPPEFVPLDDGAAR